MLKVNQFLSKFLLFHMFENQWTFFNKFYQLTFLDPQIAWHGWQGSAAILALDRRHP